MVAVVAVVVLEDSGFLSAAGCFSSEGGEVACVAQLPAIVEPVLIAVSAGRDPVGICVESQSGFEIDGS